MRKSIFSFFSLFLVSSGLLLVIIFNTNPTSSDSLTPFIFFGAAFVCIFSLIITLSYMTLRFQKKIIEKESSIVIIRRSALISLIFVGLTILNVFNVLNFLSGVTFFIVLVLLEVFFVNRRIEKRHER